MSLDAEATYKLFCEEAEKDPQTVLAGAKRLGRDSFYTLYNAVAKIISDKHALSYYYTGMLGAFDLLEEMVARMGQLYEQHHSLDADPRHREELDSLGFTPNSFLNSLRDSLYHAKYSFRTHLCFDDCDGVSCHCVRLATGAPCPKTHLFGGGRC